MHTRGRSPNREPRSKASENRKNTTRMGSIFAIGTMFIVFFYILIQYNWYGDQSTILSQNDIVIFHTELGDIRVLLRSDIAPRTTSHFKELIKADFYEGCGFYRAEKDFVLQGGATKLDKTFKQSFLPNVDFEEGIKNTRGTIGLARTENVNSGNSEYFFNLSDNAKGLGPSGDNPGYTAFGEVLTGMDILDKYSEYPVTHSSGVNLLIDIIPVTITLE